MNDISKYKKLISDMERHGELSTGDVHSPQTEVSHYVSLIESYERVDESFKTAQDKFNEIHDDPKEVQEYIEKFKELAKRNIIKGQDKDIGKWIKAGWDEFKEFVNLSGQQQSKRQYKKKVKSDSITVYEDDDKIVVIPLSEKASCYYGKNTQWCTAATRSDNKFNQYFGNDEVTLFYIFMKGSGEKIAAARYPDGDAYEYFDENDRRINVYGFEEDTGIDSDQLDAWYEENKEHIENARMKFSPKGRINHAVENYKSGEYNWSMAMAQINDAIDDMDISNEHDIKISGIDDKGNFVVDIEFIVDATEDLLKYINGDEDLDIYNPSVNYEMLFDELDTEWQNHVTSYIMDNHLGEVEELLDDDDITRSDIEGNIGDILENIEDLDELKTAFNTAEQDGSRSEVESNIMSTIMSFIKENCQELHLSIHKPLFEIIDNNNYTATLSLNDVVSFAESIEDFELGDIDTEIDLGVMDYDHLRTALKVHIGEAIGTPDSNAE